MAMLRYIDDDGKLAVRTLDTQPVVVGRGESCQITFTDDMISREHARFDMQREGRYSVRDLASRNKTHVNGELINETLLIGGDTVRVGDHVLEFLDDSSGPTKVELDFLKADRGDPAGSEWIKSKAPLSLTLTQIEQLSRVSGEQPLTARAEDIAHAALSQIMMDVQAERGVIALRGADKTELIPLATRGFNDPSRGANMGASQSFIMAPLLQGVAGRYPQSFGKVKGKESAEIAATAIAVPLTSEGKAIGVMYLDRPASKKVFTAQALSFCAACGAFVGSLISDMAHRLSRTAMREGAAWMTTMRRMQTALTQASPKSDTFVTGIKSFPGRARCGDFADILMLDEQRCCAVVIDGGGHGITGIAQAAAMRMALCTSVTVSEDALMDPGAALQAINLFVANCPARQVIGCTLLGIDCAAGKLSYINAGGMAPLLMVGPGRLITLDQPSLALGVDSEYVFESTRVDLPEKFALVCHTDGLIEATGSGGEALGHERLHELLLEGDSFTSADTLAGKVGNLFSSHLTGSQVDDDALVLVISRG